MINRLRVRLERDGFPRLQMSLLVAITGGTGFLASYFLLSTGLSTMWLRYLLVFVIAYVVFLFLLWLWLRTQARDYSDIPDFQAGPSSSGGSGDDAPIFSGKGGNFGGGGASSSYGHSVDVSSVNVSAADDGGLAGETLGAAGSADEATIPLLALAVAGALFVCSFWVIYTAPVFFAELLIDGALITGLYRHLQKIEYRHWLETAIHRTFWPFVLTAVIVVLFAWSMKFYAPEAHSLGEVILHYHSAK